MRRASPCDVERRAASHGACLLRAGRGLNRTEAAPGGPPAMAGGEAPLQDHAPLRPGRETPCCAPLQPAQQMSCCAPRPLQPARETLHCVPQFLQAVYETPGGQGLDCISRPPQPGQETQDCALHSIQSLTGQMTRGGHGLEGLETPRGQGTDSVPRPMREGLDIPLGQGPDGVPQAQQKGHQTQGPNCVPHHLQESFETQGHGPNCVPHPLQEGPETLQGQGLDCVPHHLQESLEIPQRQGPDSVPHPLQEVFETLLKQAPDCAPRTLQESFETLQGQGLDCAPNPLHECLETPQGPDCVPQPLQECLETPRGPVPDCATHPLQAGSETLRGQDLDSNHHPLQAESIPGSTGTFYGTVTINNQRLTVRIENGLLTLDAREPCAARPDVQSLALRDGGLDQLVLVSCEQDSRSGHGVRGEPTSGDSQGHPSADSSLSPDSQKDSDTMYSIDEADIMQGQLANFFIDENGEVRVASDVFGKKGLVLVYHCPQPDCRKNFDKKHKLKLHLLTQHTAQEQRPFRCSVDGCDWSFTTSYKLKRHLHSHGNLRPYTCPVESCGKTFSTIYNLKAHGKTHAMGDTFKCGVCGERFLSVAKLAGHRKMHFQPDRPYVCEFPGCEKTFTTVSALFSHNRAHFREIEQFTCSFPGCNKQYDKACRLKIHLRSHTGERPFTCDFEGCGWSFTSMSKLLRHNRKHADDRRFTCHIEGCGKSFTRAEHLKGHSIIHLGTKPFECPAEGCYAKFSARSSLYIHSKKHLQDVTTLKTRCPVSSCPRAFASKHSMKTHMVKQHNFSPDLLTQLEVTHSLTPSSELSSSAQNDLNNMDLASLFSNASSNSSGIASDMALVNSGILTIDVASVGSTLGGNLSINKSSGQAVDPLILVDNEMPHNLENSLLLGAATSLLQQSTLNLEDVQTVNAEALGSMVSLSMRSSNQDLNGLTMDTTTLTSSSLGGGSTVPEPLATIKAERNLLEGSDVVSQQEGNKVVTQFVFPNPTGGYSAQKEMDLSTVTGSSFLESGGSARTDYRAIQLAKNKKQKGSESSPGSSNSTQKKSKVSPAGAPSPSHSTRFLSTVLPNADLAVCDQATASQCVEIQLLQEPRTSTEESAGSDNSQFSGSTINLQDLQ